MDGSAPSMHTEPASAAEALCQMCARPFPLKRPWQRYCSTECRNAFDVEFGATGAVRGVRKVKAGVSVTVLLEGPAAEHALRFGLGDRVRVVKRP